MRIPKGNIERICLDEPTGLGARYRLDCVKYEVENSRIIATDGHSLIRCTVVVDEGDVSGFIPAHAFWLARRLGLSCIKTSATGVDVVSLHNPPIVVASFPPVVGVWPKIEMMDAMLDATGEAVLAFNLGILRDTMRAMDSGFEEGREPDFSHVALFLQNDHDESKAFIVAPMTNSKDKSVALIMPVLRKDMRDDLAGVAKRGQTRRDDLVKEEQRSFDEVDALRVVRGEEL